MQERRTHHAMEKTAPSPKARGERHASHQEGAATLDRPGPVRVRRRLQNWRAPATVPGVNFPGHICRRGRGAHCSVAGVRDIALCGDAVVSRAGVPNRVKPRIRPPSDVLLHRWNDVIAPRHVAAEVHGPAWHPGARPLMLINAGEPEHSAERADEAAWAGFVVVDDDSEIANRAVHDSASRLRDTRAADPDLPVVLGRRCHGGVLTDVSAERAATTDAEGMRWMHVAASAGAAKVDGDRRRGDSIHAGTAPSAWSLVREGTGGAPSAPIWGPHAAAFLSGNFSS